MSSESQERNELSESSFFSSLYISSPLTKCSEKVYRPDIYSFLDDGVQVERIANEIIFPVRLVEYPHLD